MAVKLKKRNRVRHLQILRNALKEPFKRLKNFVSCINDSLKSPFTREEALWKKLHGLEDCDIVRSCMSLVTLNEIHSQAKTGWCPDADEVQRGTIFISICSYKYRKGIFISDRKKLYIVWIISWFNQECTFFSFDEIFKITKLDLLFSPFTEGLFYVNVGT